jgi:prepilin-type N-terminal cleavage/methylation domain-containing protein
MSQPRLRTARPRFEKGASQCFGFTLVELLVVIAIIAVLIALLLPAVQAAREASRNSQCKNNLKQLGLAAQNFYSVQKRFPSGGWNYHYVGDPDCGLGLRQPGGWPFSLLPFLEEKAIFAYAKGQPNKVVAIGWMEGMPASTYFCPSRRPPYLGEVGFTSETNYNADTTTTQQHGQCRSDYAGNAGTYVGTGTKGDQATCDSITADAFGGSTSGVDASKLPWSEAQLMQNYYSKCPKFQNMNGILFALSHVTIRQITDGASKTYLIGEKWLAPAWYSTSSNKLSNDSNASDNGSMYQGHDSDNIRWTGNNADASPITNGPLNSPVDFVPLHDTNMVASNQSNPTNGPNGMESQRNNFGSAHATSCNFVMCDGSTQSISYTVDKEIHWKLGDRNDGLNFKPPWSP